MRKGDRKEPKISVLEKHPLSWPDGVPRTRLQDRQTRNIWKNTMRQAIAALTTELERFGCLTAVITSKDPHDPLGAPDPSIAVYFSRPREEDFSWQHALQIASPSPTIDEINAAFRKLSAPHHSDAVDRGSGGNIQIWHALQEHKKNALNYVKRRAGETHDLVIPCDRYKTPEQNITAITNSVRSFRQLERDGCDQILERALENFRPALPQAQPTPETVGVK